MTASANSRSAIGEAPAARRPVAADARLHVLDVLRGLSLFGILQANVLVFSGLLFMALVGDLTPTPLDKAVGFVIEALVHGKFYSLFSLLFGIGFHVFLSRAGTRGGPARPLFRRRLWLLIAAGFAIHWAVRQAFKPLVGLAEAVERRSPRDLSPID